MKTTKQYYIQGSNGHGANVTTETCNQRFSFDNNKSIINRMETMDIGSYFQFEDSIYGNIIIERTS